MNIFFLLTVIIFSLITLSCINIIEIKRGELNKSLYTTEKIARIFGVISCFILVQHYDSTASKSVMYYSAGLSIYFLVVNPILVHLLKKYVSGKGGS